MYNRSALFETDSNYLLDEIKSIERLISNSPHPTSYVWFGVVDQLLELWLDIEEAIENIQSSPNQEISLASYRDVQKVTRQIYSLQNSIQLVKHRFLSYTDDESFMAS